MPPDAMANLQKSYEEINPETETTPIKSILKKSENMDRSRNNKKKNSHVNYAFEFDEIPQNPRRKKPKKPKSATVIDKRTGRSKSIMIDDKKIDGNHVVKAEIH